MKTFNVVYEPRVEDPVVVASFATRTEADAYMQDLETNRPQTHKFCQIEEKG
jgi:hypothetical protein